MVGMCCKMVNELRCQNFVFSPLAIVVETDVQLCFSFSTVLYFAFLAFLAFLASRTSLAWAAINGVVPKVLLVVKCCFDKHISQVAWSFVRNNWPVLEDFLQSLFALKCWPMLVYNATM